MAIITISRGSMSGGQALAECLAGASGSPCVGREIVVEAAARLGVPEKVLSEKLGVDIGDPKLYDLVVNLEGMSIPSACTVVMTAAQRPEYAITDEVRGKLQDFLLACRVKVALATRPASRGLDLEVSAAKGVVTIRGEVPRAEMLTHASTRWEKELLEIAESVQGVEAAHLDVRTFDLYH